AAVLLLQLHRTNLHRHAAGDLAHRLQERKLSIVGLDGLIRDRGDLPLEERLAQRLVRREMKIGVDGLTFAHQRVLGGDGLLHLDDHFRARPDFGRLLDELGTRHLVRGVGDAAAQPGALFHQHLVPAPGQRRDAAWNQAHPVLAGFDLFRATDDHRLSGRFALRKRAAEDSRHPRRVKLRRVEMLKLLFADSSGRVYEHPELLALARDGRPLEEPAPVPPHTTLAALPGRRPVGLDPSSGCAIELSEVRIGRHVVRPSAVAAVLPPGWTRSELPAFRKSAIAPVLPQWAYTAAAWDDRRGCHVAWALHTDRRRHWDPATHSTPDLPGRIEARLAADDNPLSRAREIAEAIRRMRAATLRGSINVNTNGSLPDHLELLIDAGLDTCRISLNSAHKPLYEAYYQPIGYGWEEVEESIRLARRRGAYTALNLLTFPGVTDQEGEADALCALVSRARLDQVQARSLAIDPDAYAAIAAR